MKSASDSVADKTANDIKLVRFNIRLNRVRDVVQLVSGDCLLDASMQGFLCNPDKSVGFIGNFADCKGSCGISVKSFVNHTHVKADDVALL